MTEIIAPINDLKRQQVIAETLRYINKARQLFKRDFADVEVLFDLNCFS